MVLIRKLLLVSLFIVFWFIPIALLFLNEPYAGTGLAFALFLFLLLSWLQPDKILLVLLKAKRIWPESEFANIFNNKCYQVGIGQVDYFSSEFLPSGLMAFQAPFSRPVIIINKASLKNLRRQEVDSLAQFITWSIKSGEAKLNAFAGLLFLPIFVPCLIFSLLRNYSGRKGYLFFRDLFAMSSFFFYRFNIWILAQFKFLGVNIERDVHKYGSVDLSELASGYLKIVRECKGLTASVLAMNVEFYKDLFQEITIKFRGRKAF